MKEAARALGADGVVGIDFDYEVLGETNGMMMGHRQRDRGEDGLTARSARRAAMGGRGRRTVNVEPRPRPGLSAVTLPPCSSTSRRTIARPMPRPPCERSIVASIC